MRLVNQTRPIWSNIGLCGVVCEPHNGLSPQVGDGWFRNSSCDEMNMPRGFTGVRVSYKIDADATPEQIKALVAQSQKRSAVYDILTNPTPVTVDVS